SAPDMCRGRSSDAVDARCTASPASISLRFPPHPRLSRLRRAAPFIPPGEKGTAGFPASLAPSPRRGRGVGLRRWHRRCNRLKLGVRGDAEPAQTDSQEVLYLLPPERGKCP